MRSEGYRRLHRVCLDMAQQPELLDVQARWLTVARASLDRSRDPDDVRSSNGTLLSPTAPAQLPFRRNSFVLQ